MSERKRPPPPPPPPNNNNIISTNNNSDSSQFAKTEAVVSSNQSDNLHFAIGDEVWIKDPSVVWIIAKIVKVNQNNNSLSAKIASTSVMRAGEEISFNTSSASFHDDLHLANPKVMIDVTALHHIHEAGILHNLRERSAIRCPYSFMASAMLAINPLRNIPEPQIEEYINKQITQTTPHPYSIAELSYQNLSFSETNQSIIISGESGAGKTETAKIVLKFLSNRTSGYDNDISNSKSSKASALPNNASTDRLDLKLLRSSPILESFGNAQTVRNNNSSRFGKFMKLCFIKRLVNSKPITSNANDKMQLVGAIIDTYLLEKSRVVYQNEMECNFHIFYILLSSPPSGLNLIARDISKYKILSHSTISNTDIFVNQLYDLDTISESFKTVGLNENQINGIWRVLAGILHISNISFDEVDSKEGSIATINQISKETSLSYASSALMVDPTALTLLLTQRSVNTKGEIFTIPLTVRDAMYTRDATIKAIYDSLFHSIVNKINLSLYANNNNTNPTSGSGKQPAGKGLGFGLNFGFSSSNKNAQAPTAAASSSTTNNANNDFFIGVLDIFGFENFTKNEFEQLLINYANETLQNTFNKQIFENELELFKTENIEFNQSSIQIPNNSACVELIGGKLLSIFFTLDTISRQPKPSDERFCEELHKAFNKQKEYFLPVHRKDMKSCFSIKHYAGIVRYSVDSSIISDNNTVNSSSSSWIAKNNDSIPDGLPALYLSSKLTEFQQLHPSQLQTKSTIAQASSNARRQSFINKPTIVSIFSKSMDDLNHLLLSTSCQFIRCIKPNSQMIPDVFDNYYVVDQLRALGVLQACEVLKVGLPTRIKYSELKLALQSIISQVEHLFQGENEKIFMACLLKAYDIPTEVYKLGKTMVFFKPGQLSRLELLLKSDNNNSPESIKQLIKKIQDSLFLSKSVMSSINNTSNKIEDMKLTFQRIDDDYQSIMLRSNDHHSSNSDKSKTRAAIFNEETKKLIIPEDIASLIHSIDKSLSQLKHKYKKLSLNNLSIDGLITENSSLLTSINRKYTFSNRSEELNKQCTEVKKMIDDSFNNYTQIQELIQVIEDNVGSVLSPSFFDSLKESERLLELLRNLILKNDKLLTNCIDDAERCEITSSESLLTLIKENINNIEVYSIKIEEYLQIANKEYDELTKGNGYVDFNEVKTLCKTTVKTLESTLKLIPPIQTFSDQMKTEIEDVLNGEKIKKEEEEEKKNKEQAVIARKKKPSPPVDTPNGKKVEKTIEIATPTVVIESEWKEVIDKKSGRPYYVNHVTKERQWNKPKGMIDMKPLPVNPSTMDSSTLITESSATLSQRPLPTTVPLTSAKPSKNQKPTNNNANTTSNKSYDDVLADLDGHNNDNEPLPEGWKEVLDKKSNRYFYVNDKTKERQWKRPVAKRKSTRIVNKNIKNNDEEEEDDEHVTKAMDRVSKRLSRKPKGSLAGLTTIINNQPPKLHLPIQQLTKEEIIAEKIVTSRRNQRSLYNQTLDDIQQGNEFNPFQFQPSRFNQPYQPEDANLTFATDPGKVRTAVSHMDYSPEYFDRIQDAHIPGKGKSIILAGTSLTSFTLTESCFCVSNAADLQELSTWYLLAENTTEMESWMTAINAHVHVKFLQENQITSDYWEEGNIETSIWK
eukprot:gene10564-14190_t